MVLLVVKRDAEKDKENIIITIYIIGSKYVLTKKQLHQNDEVFINVLCKMYVLRTSTIYRDSLYACPKQVACFPMLFISCWWAYFYFCYDLGC